MPLQATEVIGRPDTKPQFRPTFGKHEVTLLPYALREKVNISLFREHFCEEFEGYVKRPCKRTALSIGTLLGNLLIYIFNCNWVDTRWQQYSSHLNTNSTQNTPNRTEP
jgi:hypothetical protein